MQTKQIIGAVDLDSQIEVDLFSDHEDNVQLEIVEDVSQAVGGNPQDTKITYYALPQVTNLQISVN